MEDEMAEYRLTLEGPDTPDFRRIWRVLNYMLNAGSAEWDEPIPEIAFVTKHPEEAA